MFLLISLLASLFIPLTTMSILSLDFLRFDSLLPTEQIVSNSIVLNSDYEQLGGIADTISFYAIIKILILSGIFISFIKSVVKIYKIKVLINDHPCLLRKNYILINLLNSKDAFSFFNYIFIGNEVADKDREKIIEHELIHIKRGHTYDLLVLELFSIVFWFNPLIYLFRNRLTMNHEFEADSLMVSKFGKVDYYESLLNQIYGTYNLKVLNYFSGKNHLKNRINMIKNKLKNKWCILNYVLIFPFLLLILGVMSTLNFNPAQNKMVSNTNIEPLPILNAANNSYQNLNNVILPNAALSPNAVKNSKKAPQLKDIASRKAYKLPQELDMKNDDQLTSSLTEEMNNKLTDRITKEMNKRLTPKLTESLNMKFSDNQAISL